MGETFDFIVVGGGTSGCVVASRLANAPSAPKVLLIEGGSANDSPTLRTPENRWSIVYTEPSINWGYKTTPQSHLNGRELGCPRGRGLGGSSAVNFSSWIIGYQEDFNEWAGLVDDPCWKWEGRNGVKQRFRKIERVRDGIDDEQSKMVNRELLNLHSKDGMVDLSYSQIWGGQELLAFKIAKELEIDINGDPNSGNPSGMGIAPSTFFNGARVTAFTAYLSSPPPNLTILTNNVVAKVLFDDTKRAVGVSTLSGQVYYASKEIILSAGALDSPKILLLSGIGPADELSNLSIPVIQDLPGVGNNLIDHSLLFISFLLKPKAFQTGTQSTVSKDVGDPLLDTGSQASMAWLQSSAVLFSPEFYSLPESVKTHISKTCTHELICTNLAVGSLPPLRPDAEILTLVAAIMNCQSVGSVTLSSSDPSTLQVIDGAYLSHPYDRRVATEAVRGCLELSRAPAAQGLIEEAIIAPKSDSEEDIREFCKEQGSCGLHFAGTCKMGKERDGMCVVNNRFLVRGTKGLRVVDLSVAPLMMNNHTQSTCYLIGETAAEKIINEYGL
ncbi:uncharacterized protein BP5553_09791 [Venustampulla echinocandica]|uniref:Glucose-methanol-choline oxidoreductase N-terminal domain-containing protein n=1 Tax=Venustampulla echinocandica TaxID=2656787 RepID=A0A370TAR7_9HELO|nr:uncharacterized protein BP5553_09791 [Venustampulla echinocandica]RDL31002.1 hypothetical protein BP5553_09791 [Venustampulla echinocandica]